MSDPNHVYGACKYTGGIADAQRILQEWGMTGLLIPLEPGLFVLDGPYHVSGIGPRGPVKDEDLQDCLNEITNAVGIQKAEFRCYGPEAGQVWDLIHMGHRFIRVPLELQPPLDALDDPMVREYYGVEYPLIQTH